MFEQAEFKSTRASNGVLGIGLLLLFGCILYVTLFGSEDELLGAHVRRGGIIKLIEQAIGWPLFVALMLAFGTWVAAHGIASLWKAIDARPDVTARGDRLDFHPAVKGSASDYEDISHWSVRFEEGNPVVWIHFFDPYWSLQGFFKRRTLKLEGSREQLEPIVNFFGTHPVMAEKFSE